MKNMRKTMFLFSCMLVLMAGCAAAAPLPEVFPPFTAPTLEGENVTEELFADNELTVVNFWGTFCPPCIREMPDLGNLARSMPHGSRLVGLVVDVLPGDEDMKQDALSILKRANADFLQILPVEAMMSVLRPVEAIPTTIFVDSRGKIVGQPLIGARPEKEYRAAIERILQELREGKSNS